MIFLFRDGRRWREELIVYRKQRVRSTRYYYTFVTSRLRTLAHVFHEKSERRTLYARKKERSSTRPGWKIISFRWSRGRDRARPFPVGGERPVPVSVLVSVVVVVDWRLFPGKIFLAVDDRRQRLPVVAPINNPHLLLEHPGLSSFSLPFPSFRRLYCRAPFVCGRKLGRPHFSAPHDWHT